MVEKIIEEEEAEWRRERLGDNSRTFHVMGPTILRNEGFFFL